MALLSYWKLEDLTDEQALHDIVNTGGADQVADGYDFDLASSEYMTVVDAGDDYDFVANAPFTLVAWIKPRSGSVSGRILAKYSGSYGYDFLLSAGKPYLGMKTGGGYLSLIMDDAIDANWHMVVARRVASSSTIKLWVDDGTETKTGVTTAGTLANAEPLHIGRAAHTPAGYFDGIMGDILGGNPTMGIQIYDTELSDEELGALYATGGWIGNFNGRTNPAGINGRVKSQIEKANGVQSA